MKNMHTSPPPAAVRLDSLTGLRWWAAFGVFAYHMDILAPAPYQDFLHIGNTGVSFFFILSGFVLTWSAQPQVSAPEFWWRRFSRIWPAHMVALLFAIPVFYSWNEPAADQWWVKVFSLPVLLLSVVLLQGFSLQPQILFSGNPAAWTLSCEAFFYALHPLVAPRRKLSSYGVSIILLSAIAIGIGLTLFDATQTFIPNPLSRFWEFLLGIGAAYAVKNGLRLRLPMEFIPAIIIGLILGYYWLDTTPLADTHTLVSLAKDVMPLLLALFYTIIICAVATADLENAPSWLRHRILVTLGEWSYAFYLVHATILYIALETIGRQDWSGYSVAVWGATFALALIASGALHLWVEKPLEKRLRHYGKKNWFTVR